MSLIVNDKENDPNQEVVELKIFVNGRNWPIFYEIGFEVPVTFENMVRVGEVMARDGFVYYFEKEDELAFIPGHAINEIHWPKQKTN